MAQNVPSRFLIFCLEAEKIELKVLQCIKPFLKFYFGWEVTKNNFIFE